MPLIELCSTYIKLYDMVPEEKRTEIMKVLKRVNVTQICRQKDIKPSSIYDTLNGRGKNYKALSEVLSEALKEIHKEETELNDLFSKIITYGQDAPKTHDEEGAGVD